MLGCAVEMEGLRPGAGWPVEACWVNGYGLSFHMASQILINLVFENKCRCKISSSSLFEIKNYNNTIYLHKYLFTTDYEQNIFILPVIHSEAEASTFKFLVTLETLPSIGLSKPSVLLSSPVLGHQLHRNKMALDFLWVR